LTELLLIRSTGANTPETSFYGPLANLLNAASQSLKPRVRCVMGLKNQGAGMPDGGLYTPDQFQRGADEPLAGQAPARGVIECKKVKDDAGVTADSVQVAGYLGKYRQVLVTNYRNFFLIVHDDAGRPVKGEPYHLAPSEKEFWEAAAHPDALVLAHGDRFLDYLQRVMLHAAKLTDPKDVAWFLASYARDARARMEAVGPEDLAQDRQALEQGLGLRFEGAKGERFFRSTLVQTLFYGVFSAWVLWQRDPSRSGKDFDWEKAQNYLHVPILHKLFRSLADRRQLKKWKLAEVLDWTAGVLNRVNPGVFFDKFKDAEAVQYFYEPFLEAFDPELRKQLGVWYTPPEIVRYMVARVDAVLRDELGRPDGLADPDVYVLDPCCGTGAYVVEVLRTIAATLRDKGEEGLFGDKLKAAATKRVFGFEILPAPFVVAHLQLGLFLQTEGAALAAGETERAGVYLTNALTGWEPPTGEKQEFLYPEMKEEHDKAGSVKQSKEILVVLGNPPYNGFAGVAVQEERDLSDAYRAGGDDFKPQGQGLNDLYIRFFRMAERCIAEKTRHGVVCFISNYSWLDGLSFPVMREHYLKAFDQVWIDCLNGDKYKTGKQTPDGKPDPSVFSTEHNREGIQVGTAVTLLVRKADHEEPATVRFRHLWGQTKRADLLASLERIGPRQYEKVKPERALGLPFRPMTAEPGYLTWPLLTAIIPVSFPGVQTGRDDLLVNINREELMRRMKQYFSRKVSHAEMRAIAPRALTDSARFQAVAVREQLQKRGLLSDKFLRFAYRPFDHRWLYWEPTTKLLDEKRSEYLTHVADDNICLAAVQQNRKEFDPPYVTRLLGCRHIIERGANLFPLLIRKWPESGILFGDERKQARVFGDDFVNLSDSALAYLNGLGSVADAPHLFHHVAAVLHSPAYIEENNGSLCQDWPRIPLPVQRDPLLKSADLGRQVAALLDTETPVKGVTAGKPRPELKAVGVVARVGGGSLTGADWDVTARWGVAGKGGVCMPGKGKTTERAYSEEERTALREGAAALGLDVTTALACWGATTFDVYLNDRAYWRNVPARIWSYTLGGYQVVKKWLSYREKALLGRGLTGQEATEVSEMIRRIAALLLLHPALDANYAAVKAEVYPWPGKDAMP
jgi:hypothetical protein